jgi:regulator of telomere elongation helicase 1
MLAAPGRRKRPKSKNSSELDGSETNHNDNYVQKNAASAPRTIELRGVQIHFPFKPYKCQEDYMGKVIDAMNRSENALLESPTGTGKTLCLLCSTLAWQAEYSVRLKAGDNSVAATQVSNNEPAAKTATNKPPTIIYASRTHSQLSQVVKELRFTRYRPKHAVLGSREQMCVNSKVKTKTAAASDINHMCGKLAKERKCRFRNNLEGFVSSSAESDGVGGDYGVQPVLDIEELTSLGKKRNICPFYFSRGHIAEAEIIFVPYNYLFDKDARTTSLADVQWENSILVFDEAHNLEAFASESASFDLGSIDVAGCINEVQRAIGYSEASPEIAENIKMENLARLKGIFLKFERFLDHEINAAGGSFAVSELSICAFKEFSTLNYIHFTSFKS